MSRRPERSIARLLARGRPCGTAWMIAPGIAATAKHCLYYARTHLSGSEHELTLAFPDRPICAAAWADDDLHPDLDFALLRLDVTNWPDPLLLVRRPRAHAIPFTIGWWSHGYPQLLSEMNLGTTVGGEIGQFHLEDGGKPAIQLRTQQINLTSADSALGGLSGAPIFVGDTDNRVFAVVRRSPPVTADQMQLAVPLDAVAEYYGTRLAQANWIDWPEPSTDFFDVVPGVGLSCHVEGLPAGQIHQIWEPGGRLAWLGCGFEASAYPGLSSALLRVALHAPGIVEIRVPRAQDWQDLAERLGRNWLPARSYRARERARELQWVETSEPPPLPGAGTTPQTVGELIHEACDAWVLRQLTRRVSQVLGDEDTREALWFRLHSSFRQTMPGQWEEWRRQLAADPALLRHFLAMMLTPDGEYDTTTAVIGAGPRTLEPCLLQPLIFTLAVNICLPDAFNLTPNRPGNLVSAFAGGGHACGIEFHGHEELHLSLTDYNWSTPFVFVRHLACEQRLREAIQTRADREFGAPVLGLSASMSRPVLYAGDEQMLGKLREGVPALRSHLLMLHEERTRRQQDYAARLATML